MSNKKVHLYHGENDYFLYKTLKEKKKEFDEKGIEYKEFWGSDSLSFATIYELLNSAPLFFDESVVILRNLTDGKSLYKFAEELQTYLLEKKVFNNSLLIFNQNKLAKTTKIYKAIAKVGEIEEFTNPKEDEILEVIRKSLNISNDAAVELNSRTNGNLFLIRNEILKLKNILNDKKTKIEKSDIEELCVNLPNQNDVWNLGSQFVNSLMRQCDNENNGLTTSNREKLKLIDDVEKSLASGAEPMMILYSFYNYILNFIKMKKMASVGKGFRDMLSLGYYFTKDFFGSKDKIPMETLQLWNSKLLDYEFKVKSGEVDDVMGLRELIIQ